MSGRQSEADRIEAAKRAQRIEAAQTKDVCELMHKPAFRRYLKRYLSTCSVFKTTFTGNSETFFREGQRSIGTTMLGEVMSACPQRFHELMGEPLAGDELAESSEPDEKADD